MLAPMLLTARPRSKPMFISLMLCVIASLHIIKSKRAPESNKIREVPRVPLPEVEESAKLPHCDRRLGQMKPSSCAPSHARGAVLRARILKTRGGGSHEVEGNVACKGKSWVKEIFLPQYYVPLGRRAHTFRKLFEYLEKHNITNPTIVETGTTRKPRHHPQFWEDGGSTIMFDSFVNYHKGMCQREPRVYSVDISKRNCVNCRKLVSNMTEVVCEDSVTFLHEFREKVDVLYLDSFDLDWNHPHPSALHHIKELCASLRLLKSGSVVIVDDNAQGVGKGGYVRSFMEDIGAELLFDSYQIGFVYHPEPRSLKFSLMLTPSKNRTATVRTWRDLSRHVDGWAPGSRLRDVKSATYMENQPSDHLQNKLKVDVRFLTKHELQVTVSDERESCGDGLKLSDNIEVHLEVPTKSTKSSKCVLS